MSGVGLEPNRVSEVSVNAEENKGGKTQRSLLTALHLFCIAAFAMFLCWGAQGKAPVNGDDIRVIHRIMLKKTNLEYDYLAWTRSRMHTVALLYEEYKLAGESLEKGNLIWLGIYVASAFAAYVYLRKVFNPTVALTGAIFYLCYSSKFEPLTWWSAGAYTVIWFAFFGLLGALESKLGYRTKCVVVSSIILLSLYIYEVFTVLVPFISLILLMRRNREIGCLKKQDWLFACSPIIVLIIHVATLASATSPIFLFESSTVGKAPFAQRLTAGFTSALDATVGPKHNVAVKKAGHVYRQFYSKDEPMLNTLLWGAIGLFVVALLAGAKGSFSSPTNLVTVGETALLGGIALFISAFIGFVSNFCITPSRLTGIPSVGLMLLVCVALQLLFAYSRSVIGWKKSALAVTALLAPLLVLAWSVREVQAFSGLLKQAGEVDDFDLKLGKRIQALHPVPVSGDEIYVRMPLAYSESIGRWKNFWSGFNSGRGFETLWYLYGVEPGVMNFTCTPFKYPGEDSRMQVIVENWAKTGRTKVYPYFVDDHQNVFPIPKIVLTDIQGHELKTLEFSKQFADYQGKMAETQRIPIFKLPAGL